MLLDAAEYRRTHAGRAIATIGLAVMACAGHDPQARSVVGSVQPDVVLREDSTGYIGRANGFMVSASGDFLVSDASRGMVQVFNRNGELVRMIGRKGRGPGELTFPASLALIGDTLLAVLDFAASRIAFFDAGAGNFRRFVTLPVRFWGLSSVGDTLYGGVGLTEGGSVRGISSSGVDVFAAGPIPSLFQRVPAAAAIFGQMEALVPGDSLITAFEVSDAVYITSLTTAEQDSIRLPVVNRRGVQHRLRDAIRAEDPAVAQRAVYQSSMPIGLATIPGDKLLVLTLDPEYATSRLAGRVFASVIDLSSRRVCADERLDVATDPLPRFSVRGDTIFALIQEVGADSLPRSKVRMLRLDLQHCEWRPSRG